MKKRFLLPILMLICTVMLLSACGSNNKTVGDSVPNDAENSIASTEATESGSNSVEVIGESAGTDKLVTPPKGWKPADSGGAHLVDYSNGTAHFWVEKKSIGASNPDEMAQAMKSAYERSSVFRNIEFIGEMESITLGGKDARKLVFNYEAIEPSSVKKMKREDIFLILGEDFYKIVFEDTSDHFDKLAGILSKY